MNNETAAQITPEDDTDEFYAKHKKVYPREVHGLFATWRVIGVFVLLGLYYLVPWFNYDGHQAVLFDLPARKFYIFGLTFWPQDFIYLAILLIIAALSLFFFTALAGRLWCGYACPQTVWTEVFLWIERKVEGNRNKQIKLDKLPLTSYKFSRKALKHFLWITLSAWTGLTFVGYFTPITELVQSIFNFATSPWETFWIIFYGFATYGNAGWMREQVCIYMCPYARFQSAMFDKNTLIISYNQDRGEPRGSRKKSDDSKAMGMGDCIDCNLCVHVCPTGIDIRNGLQYQCIGCAACIDVCNDVMDKMNYPRQLIKYTTQNSMDNMPARILRPRVLIYFTLLILMTAVLITSMAKRIPLELDIIRDRNALYRHTAEGLIENSYTLKVINMDTKIHTYHLSLDGLEGFQLVNRQGDITAASGEIINLLVQVRINPIHLKKAGNDIQFHLKAIDNPELTVVETGRFIGPVIK